MLPQVGGREERERGGRDAAAVDSSARVGGGRAGGGCPPAREPTRRSVDSADAAPAARRLASRRVTDMRGVAVDRARRHSPGSRRSDDGFVEAVMTRLGVDPDACGRRRRTACSAPGRTRTRSIGGRELLGRRRHGHDAGAAPVDGRPAVRQLRRRRRDQLRDHRAAAKPQVVILRVGDCTLGTSPEVVARTAGRVLSAMGIPVVVLRSPADYRGQGLETLRARDRAARPAVRAASARRRRWREELSDAEAMVQARLRRRARTPAGPACSMSGWRPAPARPAAPHTCGAPTPTESWMIERIVGARNAYRGPGARVLLNAEQILALDPDVIFLPTSAGYHPPRELIEAPYFRELQRLRAVREKRDLRAAVVADELRAAPRVSARPADHGEGRLSRPLPRSRRPRVGARVLPPDLSDR
ncbi:MAG: hypothetical protein M0C28_23170 [Candidatus Moduliflexus flocculans]|nr:hypothetical protein [Candidatus Moduliflexus flocculans]